MAERSKVKGLKCDEDLHDGEKEKEKEKREGGGGRVYTGAQTDLLFCRDSTPLTSNPPPQYPY